ncbi:MAG TPA: divergent PAP2 family protein [Clostridiaceae bacterium]|jgi:acid phosphatase family membrane protein YuiD|nr:divergent PAP2 family protein [Clostridiaceae bacterium]
MNFFIQYKYLLTPFLIWFCIQTFKVFYDLVKTKKFNFKRIMGAGGMPSSHSAVVTCLATMVGKSQGIETPIFAVSVVFAFVVMYDAAGIRRAAGKQAKLLNKIIETPGLSGVQVSERLVEVLGHTPTQVVVGAIIGIIVGLII